MVCSCSKCHGYARKQSHPASHAFSNAVDPRKLYPAHFDHLMRNLYHSGQLADARMPPRFDEDGMEVEFTLVQHGTDLVWHRSVLVCAGQLARIVTV